MTHPTPTLVDAHTHVFAAVQGRIKAGPTRGLGRGRISIGSQVLQLTPDLGEETVFRPDMLLAEMDAAGVERAVLLQGTYYGACNAFAAQAVRQHPERLVGQAYLDPWVLGWEDELAGLVNDRAFCGVKLEFSESNGLCGLHPGARLDEARLDVVWGALEGRGKVLTLDLGGVGSESYQTEAVAGIAAAHPGMKVVVCHLGQPSPAVLADAGLRRAWEAQVCLGRLGNLYLDTASLPAFYRQEGEPFRGCREALRRAVDLVGTEKILWGTDAPGTLTLCTYQRYTELARAHTSFLTPTQQQQVLADNARRVYFAAA